MRLFAEKVRTWRRAGFTLELWDTQVPTGTGRLAHTLLAYRLSDRGRTVFAGDGFAPPLGVAIDSDECVAACLFWLALKPGEVEEEFFDGYTHDQWAWIESGRADDLSTILWHLEGDECSDC
jgi:hypothetical protein